jgi:hypothetical protein
MVVLSNPHAQWVFKKDEVTVTVYQAKKLQETFWCSSELKQLVGRARSSYQRYGAVPIYDAYDDRAAVFVAVIRYPVVLTGLSVMHEEVVSVRFVPGYGDRPTIEDFEIFQVDGESLTEFLQHPPHEHRAVLERLVSISRFCATSPQPVQVGDGFLQVATTKPLKRKATTLAFIIMNYCFFSGEGAHFEYISGVMRRELMASLARGSRVEALWPRCFPQADDFLMCGPCDIKLRRDTDTVYRYPSYFLDTRQLQEVLNEFIDTDRLSIASFKNIVGEECITSSHIISYDAFWPRAGSFLCHEGQFYQAAITGQYLRDCLNKRVSDAPHLHVGYVDFWRDLLQRSLSAFTLKLVDRVSRVRQGYFLR